MKVKQVLWIGLMSWPVLMFSAEPESPAVTSVKKILREAGAPMPMSMTLPVRGAVPHLELGDARVMNENVIVSLRCRPRKGCGEIVGTLRYGNAGEATAVQEMLRGAKPVRSPRIPKVIRAGTRVVLSLSNERMMLRMRVDTLGSGGVGERIRVRDRESHKIYVVVVTGPGEVKGEL